MANKSLQQLVAEQAGTAAEIAVVLNTPSVEQRRAVRIGWRGVAKVSQGLSATISLGLKAVIDGMKGVTDPAAIATRELLSMSLDSYRCDDGLDFSDEDVRSQIDILCAMKVWDDATCEAIKALGVWYISPCEVNKLPLATEADVQAELDAIAATNAAGVHSQLTAFAINELFNGQTFATWAELQDAVAKSGGP